MNKINVLYTKNNLCYKAELSETAYKNLLKNASVSNVRTFSTYQLLTEAYNKLMSESKQTKSFLHG